MFKRFVYILVLLAVALTACTPQIGTFPTFSPLFPVLAAEPSQESWVIADIFAWKLRGFKTAPEVKLGEDACKLIRTYPAGLQSDFDPQVGEFAVTLELTTDDRLLVHYYFTESEYLTAETEAEIWQCSNLWKYDWSIWRSTMDSDAYLDFADVYPLEHGEPLKLVTGYDCKADEVLPGEEIEKYIGSEVVLAGKSKKKLWSAFYIEGSEVPTCFSIPVHEGYSSEEAIEFYGWEIWFPTQTSMRTHEWGIGDGGILTKGGYFANGGTYTVQGAPVTGHFDQEVNAAWEIFYPKWRTAIENQISYHWEGFLADLDPAQKCFTMQDFDYLFPNDLTLCQGGKYDRWTEQALLGTEAFSRVVPTIEERANAQMIISKNVMIDSRGVLRSPILMDWCVIQSNNNSQVQIHLDNVALYQYSLVYSINGEVWAVPTTEPYFLVDGKIFTIDTSLCTKEKE